MNSQLIPVLLGFTATILLIWGLKPIALRLAWVDKPDNTRKLHETAIPLTGGLAMVLAYIATIFYVDDCKNGCSHLFLTIGIIFMSAVGLWDDKFHLSARFRLLLQSAIAWLLVLAADLNISNLGNLFGGGAILLPEIVGHIFTVFCVVGAMNAINMIDGVDGLAGGVVVVAMGWMLYLTSLAHIPETSVLLTLIGCVTGYLCFNMRGPFRKRASIFMGDAGSMMLGVALAWLLISLSQPDSSAPAVIPPVVGLWLVAVPLLDTISLMLKRGLNGKSPFRADRDHFHHILQDAGLNHCQTTLAIISIATILGAIGVFSWTVGVGEPALFLGFLVLSGSYYYFIHHTSKLAAVVRQMKKS